MVLPKNYHLSHQFVKYRKRRTLKKLKIFLKNYNGRIDKSSNNVKQTFTLDNMARAYYEFDTILHECKDSRIVVGDLKKPVSFYLPSISKDMYGSKSKKKIKEVSMCDLTMKIQGTTIPSTLHAVCHASELECCIPGCLNKASNWHHIKHRKNYKGSDSTRKLLSYTAKQIPVCKAHHFSIHSGKYDGPSLRKLKGFVPEDFLDD
jgi:hypothetical protein